MVSKALVVGAYQRKAEEIARLGVDLHVLVPPSWQDRRGHQVAEASFTHGYQYKVIPIRFNGNFHLHYYPTLVQEIAQIRPHILHMDEEPYNLATWLGLRAAKRHAVQCTFFTWQNLYRRYPPPFCWLEQAVYRHTPIAIAGNRDAADVLTRKGFKQEIALIPQFGVAPDIFCPDDLSTEEAKDSVYHIGYAGGLLQEKGVDLLLQACAGLRGAWHLHIVGEGSERETLQQLTQQLQIARRVQIHRRLPSAAMPDFYREIDVFVLPSRSTSSWQEQFGRVLIEAMASEVAVIASDSGEIPNVVGKAGLIFAENSVKDLRKKLQVLMDNKKKRQQLGKAGRRRVLNHYTMASVAQQTVEVYEKMLRVEGGKWHA